MKLIFGLGNPEPDYSWSRHNVGKEFANFLFKGFNENVQGSWEPISASWQQNKKTHAQEAKFGDLILIKPDGYMNSVGEVIKKSISYYKVQMNDVIVAYDELDFEVGEYRFAFQKGSNIHNGIKSINDTTGGNTYWNLRIGVREPEIGFSVQKSGRDPSQYVLQKLPISHKKKISDLFKEIADKDIKTWLSKKE